jgi:serine/threonine protein kinase
VASYCCFHCPAATYDERSLQDHCPTCGREFGFPLDEAPAEIDRYRILKPLGRGFYAATYVAERKSGLKGKVVLKVTPKSFYEFFSGKKFQEECQLHQDIAEGTEHLVKIHDMLADVDVSFGAETLACCVAELEYIEGPLLAEYFENKEGVSAQVAAQVAIDLLRLREELEKRHIFHNDLHAGNILIEKLKKERYRANAVDPSVRAVAIDLGSAAGRSKSDAVQQRAGDLSRIAEHISRLVAGLLRDPDRVSDHDFRLASTLQSIFHVLAAPAENTRLPAAQELIRQITLAYEKLPRHSWRSSWREPLSLSSFGSYYNALTLEPWHVPALLIDPEGSWLDQISTPGPQVITGMRGCGKTMLLRALQFHARASQAKRESDAAVIARIRGDRYVGLFVSAQRLLDKTEGAREGKDDPFVRLVLAYALEAVRSIMRLKDIDDGHVIDHAHRIVAAVLQLVLSGLGDLTEAVDLDELDFRLSRALVQQSRDAAAIGLQAHASDAFVHLAEAIRGCSESWANSQILFLLDDVSTRYLKAGKIRKLLSALLFQSPICAFKITSEVQTMELELKTPGEDLPAREGRDYSVFDLGSEVYDRIKGRNGKDFVEAILSQRAAHFSAHPDVKPSQILGDINLETIAREIAQSSSTSSKRKEVYRGITAVAHVCVGDIGDVISLYERIIKAANGRHPVPPQVQCDCFQDHCSHRLYDLNRRGGELKDVARSFAEASYELLVKSFRDDKKSGRKVSRLRQYCSIYVRVTTGDTGKQMNQLRELIDAGVFVFTGGRPRTKTKDSDPILQFKLTFRRIYGLTNFIGLAERDRFELSGTGLVEWLSDPSGGKEVLLRNLGGGVEEEESQEEGAELTRESAFGATQSEDVAPTLFDRLETPQRPFVSVSEPPLEEQPVGHSLCVKALTEGEVAASGPVSVVLGLGFEERTLKSVEELVRIVRPSKVFAIQYAEHGKSKQILKVLDKWGADVRIVPYESALTDGVQISGGTALVDVTGLAKPVIFHSVRESLRDANSVLVAHTRARSYYPTESDMKALLKAERNRKKFFDTLSGILTGERGPYQIVPLLEADADETRRNVLFAFASPKHERLLSLIDSRVIDRLEVVAPNGDTSRNRVARQIAQIAATDNASADVTLIDSDDLATTVDYLFRGFARWYVQQGYNFEVGLTGSKMEAVASAAISAFCKVTQCWYVRPQRFDPLRFTKGAGETRFYKIMGSPRSA